MTSNINHTRSYKQGVKLFFAACLLITFLSPFSAVSAQTLPSNRAIKVSGSITNSIYSFVATVIALIADPPKPDPHNSNGDDLPVRPPR